MHANDTDIGIGAHVRAIRLSRGWTQADLSHFTRLSTGDISRIECGRLIPTRSQVERLRRALGTEQTVAEAGR